MHPSDQLERYVHVIAIVRTIVVPHLITRRHIVVYWRLIIQTGVRIIIALIRDCVGIGGKQVEEISGWNLIVVTTPDAASLSPLVVRRRHVVVLIWIHLIVPPLIAALLLAPSTIALRGNVAPLVALRRLIAPLIILCWAAPLIALRRLIPPLWILRRLHSILLIGSPLVIGLLLIAPSVGLLVWGCARLIAPSIADPEEHFASCLALVVQLDDF